jgi:hypothetical protein
VTVVQLLRKAGMKRVEYSCGFVAGPEGTMKIEAF